MHSHPGAVLHDVPLSDPIRYSWPLTHDAIVPDPQALVEDFRSPDPQDGRRMMIGQELQRQCIRLNTLRDEALASHSNLAYAFRLFTDQQDVVDRCNEDHNEAVRNLNSDDNASVDHVRATHERLSTALRDLKELGQQVDANRAERLEQDYNITLEHSVFSHQLEELLGPLPQNFSPYNEPDNLVYMDDEVEDPEPLKRYYEQVGWIGVLKERLEELRYEHEISRRGGSPSVEFNRRLRNSVASSENEFQRAEISLIHQMTEARRRADDWERECMEQNIEIQYRAVSSRVESEADTTNYAVPLPGTPPLTSTGINDRVRPIDSITAEEFSMDEIGPQDQPVPSSIFRSSMISRTLSPRRQASGVGFLEPQAFPFSPPGSVIEQWRRKLQGPPKANTTSDDETFSCVEMRSTRSLPDCVMVDLKPKEKRASWENENTEQAEIRRKQLEIGMSLERRFAGSRPFHSDSSLLPEPNKQSFGVFRRATIQGIEHIKSASSTIWQRFWQRFRPSK